MFCVDIFRNKHSNFFRLIIYYAWGIINGHLQLFYKLSPMINKIFLNMKKNKTAFVNNNWNVRTFASYFFTLLKIIKE